ncbi:VOC family protein [Phytoactinopolyspora halotolerans]|uniref:VOC family protein n=1 Tax=Phytoactinopolyspora halotolerans TaxID=1981512 RepID=A0A6L9S424_9ACTN|nr:VOC family protein [Phytoactinopolyspora halotolerans]NED99590.1 VOC family protein [Phytoactinopolyspora halotolerans]
MSQKITPCLWFEDNAEEALEFYTSIFDDARVTSVSRYGEGGPFTAGTLLMGTLELAGQQFMVLNGGPHDAFNDAVSFYIECETQEEVDRYWDALLAGGGQPTQCGWLKDKFGVSWQVIPEALRRYMNDPDQEKAQRVMEAMLKMVKIDVPTLDAAYAGR